MTDRPPRAGQRPGPRRLGALLADPAPLRLDRDYRLLWSGQLVSAIGRTMTTVVLPYHVYVLTGDLLAVGLLALVQLAPILVFALGAGAIADAVDRRRLLLVTQAGLAVSTAALAGIALLPEPPLLAIYAVAAVSAGLTAMDQPARSAAVPRLVPPERLPAAIALNSIMFTGMSVVGPAIGGLVLAVGGIAVAYALDTATYLVALVTVLRLRPIPPAEGAARPSLRTVAEGLRYVRGRREILASFAIDLSAMVFAMPRALFPAIALDVLRAGPLGVGLMTSAMGTGAFLAAIFSGWTARVPRPGLAVVAAAGTWSLAMAGFGLATLLGPPLGFPLALLLLAVGAAADGISAILRQSIVQLTVPDELRGRVSSIHILVVTAGPRLGDAQITTVAALVGPSTSVVAGGLLSLAGLALAVLALPEFLRVRMTGVRTRA